MMAKREKPYGRGKRDDAQLEILLDLVAVGVHEIEIHGRDRAGLEAHAEPSLELVAEADEVLPADRYGPEVLDVERQKTEAVNEDIVRHPRILGSRAESAHVETEGLLSRRRRRRGKTQNACRCNSRKPAPQDHPNPLTHCVLLCPSCHSRTGAKIC